MQTFENGLRIGMLDEAIDLALKPSDLLVTLFVSDPKFTCLTEEAKTLLGELADLAYDLPLAVKDREERHAVRQALVVTSEKLQDRGIDSDIIRAAQWLGLTCRAKQTGSNYFLAQK